MDSMTKVREMRQFGGSDLTAARTALEAEISSVGGARGRHTRGMVIGGGAIAAGVVLAASLVGGIHPSPASAQEILENAAALQVALYDTPLEKGQFLRTTYVRESLSYLGAGWQEEAEPFSTVPDDAIAAVLTGSSDVSYRSADPSDDVTHDTDDYYGIAAYGDTAAAEAAWADYYMTGGAAKIGKKNPGKVWRTGSSAQGTGFLEWELQGEIPEDPQAFLDAWTARAGAIDPESDAGTRTGTREPALDRLWRLVGDVDFANASGHDRAVVLRALALTDGAEVVSTSGDLSVVQYHGEWGTYRLTIDTAKGQLVKVQTESTRGIRYAADSSDESVVDIRVPAFVPEGTYASTETITQDVVDAAPQTDDRDD
ncbi:hypothetical protein [Microbacterium sp.]|uniref:hypothetical protein n=1 Tax=Microbacterium sp. TaxID=51671 RepID=UPI003C746DDF